MKGLRLLLSVLILGVCLTANAKKPPYSVVVAENQRLAARADSLDALLAQCRATLDSLTSLPVETPSSEEETQFALSDSLLHSWYIQQHGAISGVAPLDSEMFSSNVPDAVFIDRLSRINSVIPLDFNTIVKNYCILFAEKMPSAMSRMMGDAQYYWPIMDECLSAAGVPLELKAMSIVESRLVPTVKSRMGAVGLWQFMYRTGKGYGLKIDSWQDERMDPVKSSYAAGRYLRDAYNMFGDWTLAIASYNCGMGCVTRAIRRSGGKTDFWAIYDYLPRETRGYVPAFIGALYAVTYYREHGIVPCKTGLQMPVDTVVVNSRVHFGQLHDLLGVGVDTLRRLNPQYLHDIVPASCALRLPLSSINAYLDVADTLSQYRSAKYFDPVEIKKIEDGVTGSGNRLVYKVKSGDVLGRIAVRYNVKVADLKRWNGLKSNTIRVGQKLVIYTSRR